jgi:L-asparaginase II
MGYEPISVAVTRGDTVESVHRVHAVAVDADGARVVGAGDTGLLTFFRSAAKPLQALPLARAREDLDDREIAIACASHLADEDQLAAVRSLLAKAPATEDDLECGPAGDPPERIKHNCSGKHAGMLALCRARGWDAAGYRLAEHRCQRTMLAEVAAAAGLAEHDVAVAVDGCGVSTFAVPLDRMALAFARLAQIEGGDRVTRAMRAWPELIRGSKAPDTQLMRALRGWVAKGGAEALFCAATSDGLGVALKVEDGSARAVAPAVAALLADLGHDLPGLASAPVRNSRGDDVGEIAPVRAVVNAGTNRFRQRRRAR